MEENEAKTGPKSMTPPLVNGLDGGFLKFLIVGPIFPVLVAAFHLLLTIPAVLLGALLVHFAGRPQLWGRVLSLLMLLPACWAAVRICKLMWPGAR